LAHDAGHGGDVDDLPRALAAHDREHGAHHVHDAPEVRRELPLDLLGGKLLEVAEQAVAGVVDQHVDAAEPRDGGISGPLHLGLAGDVQPLEQQVVAGDVGEGAAQLLRVPAGRHDPVPRLESGPGNAGTDAAAGSSDKPDLAHVAPLIGHLLGPGAVTSVDVQSPSSELVKYGKVPHESHQTPASGDTNSRKWLQVVGDCFHSLHIRLGSLKP
jgi:hypothetical protein